MKRFYKETSVDAAPDGGGHRVLLDGRPMRTPAKAVLVLPNAALAEAIKSDANTKDSFARMIDHLKANDVNTDSTNTVVGPLLTVDKTAEAFKGADKTIVAAANKNPLTKRTGRGAYTIPEFKKMTVAAS